MYVTVTFSTSCKVTVEHLTSSGYEIEKIFCSLRRLNKQYIIVSAHYIRLLNSTQLDSHYDTCEANSLEAQYASLRLCAFDRVCQSCFVSKAALSFCVFCV